MNFEVETHELGYNGNKVAVVIRSPDGSVLATFSLKKNGLELRMAQAKLPASHWPWKKVVDEMRPKLRPKR